MIHYSHYLAKKEAIHAVQPILQLQSLNGRPSAILSPPWARAWVACPATLPKLPAPLADRLA